MNGNFAKTKKIGLNGDIVEIPIIGKKGKIGIERRFGKLSPVIRFVSPSVGESEQ